MALKKGDTPKTIRAILNFTSPAEKFEMPVTFNNLSTREFREKAAGATVADLLLQLLAGWDCDYALTADGITELEEDHPGICDGLIEAWWRSRTVALEKN